MVLYAHSNYYTALSKKSFKQGIQQALINTKKFKIILKFASINSEFSVLGRQVEHEIDPAKSSFVYVGDVTCTDESPSIFHKYIVPNLADWKNIYHFDPNTGVLEEYVQAKKSVMLRYSNIEKVQEAQIIGILIGTVACDNYMDVINQLKAAIIQSGKKFYEVLVGKLNEPKLKNF